MNMADPAAWWSKNAPARRQNLIAGAIIAVLLSGLVIRAISMLKSSISSEVLLHALLFNDIVENGNILLSNWYLPKNNYFFTDFIFHAAFSLPAGMVPLAIKSATMLPSAH